MRTLNGRLARAGGIGEEDECLSSSDAPAELAAGALPCCNPLMLKLESCRQRQQRLLRALEEKRLAFALLSNPKTIYYFAGALTDPALPQLFWLHSSGRSALITNQAPKQAAVDRTLLYTGYTIERPFNRSTMAEEAAALLQELPAGGPAGVERDFLPCCFHPGAETVDLTPLLDDLRRIKDPDELESIRNTIRLTEAGYAAVRGRLEPGMTEFQVYSLFYQALVEHAETSVDLRGDFACGTRAIRGGGPPTARQLAQGDLYILDIFPFYQGYHCDLTRTFAVGRPTDLQRQAWELIRQAHELAARLIRPGVRGREVYQQIRGRLETFQPTRGSFWHHLGHGFGMNGWEFPWLTPGSDHLVQQGEVLAVEPAVYGECLQGGIRIEHDYLVGAEGVTRLDSHPIEL